MATGARSLTSKPPTMTALNEAQDAGYRIRIYHLADPTSEYHAANRKYVDDAIASIDTNINLDNYLPLVGGDMTGRIDITLADPVNPCAAILYNWLLSM